MAIDTTATGSQPYYDDYSDSGNADKNYLRILFQPGRGRNFLSCHCTASLYKCNLAQPRSRPKTTTVST